MGPADWRPTPEALAAISRGWAKLWQRSWVPPDVERADLHQAAMIALWQRWESIKGEPAMATVVARSAMIDEIRRQCGDNRRSPGQRVRPAAAEVHDDFIPELPDPETPDEVLQARQLLARLAAMPDPWPARIDALVTAPDKRAAAALLGVTEQRVTQYCAKLRQVLAA